jgi:hypothetical protein
VSILTTYRNYIVPQANELLEASIEMLSSTFSMIDSDVHGAITGTLIGIGTAKFNANKLQDYEISGIPPSLSQVLVYNSVSTKWEPTTVAIGGVSHLEIKPSDITIDGTDIGADLGSFGVINTIDFDPDTDGAIYFSRQCPVTWDESKDINITLNYSLNGSDVGKFVAIITDIWTLEPGGTVPESATPEATYSDSIISDADNIGKYNTINLTNGKISASSFVSTTKYLVVRIKRDATASADTYTGTLQLISVLLYQV